MDPRMTAEQFADYAEVDTELFSLQQLGKIAKEHAGRDYATVANLRYGQVGYVNLSYWISALFEMYCIAEMPMSVKMYLNFLEFNISDMTRYAIESIAFTVSHREFVPVEVGEGTERYPLGGPLFTPEVIKEAIHLVLSVS